MSIAALLVLREAGSVQRYHTSRMLRTQTLAEHSWGVAMLVRELWPTCSVEVLEAALTHDLAELETGDIPAPAKWRHAALKQQLDILERAFHARNMLPHCERLVPHEREILKWCDMADLVLWCIEEMKLGNSYARTLAENGYTHLLTLPWPTIDGFSGSAVAKTKVDTLLAYMKGEIYGIRA